MLSQIAIFLVAFVLLAKGADYFVEYSARVAKRFNVSDFIIGLTITSIGTSVPELAASISASLNGSPGLVVGNVVGSNIANIGLILGLSATLSAFQTERKMYERDGFIMIASVLLFFAFVLNNQIGRIEAIVLLLAYIFYLVFLIKTDQEERPYQFRNFMQYVFDFEYMTPLRSRLYTFLLRKPKEERTPKEAEMVKRFSLSLLKEVSIVIASCVAVVFGAKYLISSAIWFADLMDIPENVVGLSIVAVGTSLPELTVSLSAARKGRGGIVVGNVLGSNIANVFLILGVSANISPLEVTEVSVTYTIPIMLFFSLALLYFIKSDWQVKRYQGVLAMLLYVLFIALAFLQGWS